MEFKFIKLVLLMFCTLHLSTLFCAQVNSPKFFGKIKIQPGKEPIQFNRLTEKEIKFLSSIGIQAKAKDYFVPIEYGIIEGLDQAYKSYKDEKFHKRVLPLSFLSKLEIKGNDEIKIFNCKVGSTVVPVYIKMLISVSSLTILYSWFKKFLNDQEKKEQKS